MNRRILITVLLVAVIAVATAVVLPSLDTGQRRVTVDKLPWDVRRLPDGGSQVFGWSLGRTTLEQISTELGSIPEVGVFVGPGDAIVAEAYFGRVRMGVLEARLVARLGIDEPRLRVFASRFVKGKPMPSGARRLEMQERDLRVAYASPVVALSYIPYAQYERSLIQRRFGEPVERIELSPTSAWWLYPEMGLAILVDDDGREVLEYVQPGAFATLRDQVTERAPVVRAK